MKRSCAAFRRRCARRNMSAPASTSAPPRAGINMDAVAQMGQIIKAAAELTADRDGIGAAKLVAFCNAVEDNPFMAGAFHGPGEPDCVINVGVSGPGVVKSALTRVQGEPFDVVAENHQKDGVPHYAHGAACGAGSISPPWRAFRHCGSFACAYARCRRFRGAYPH